jgi:NAD(P)-dependent dehydrogenase (short-subunit alcohol dehydrogenase family)
MTWALALDMTQTAFRDTVDSTLVATFNTLHPWARSLKEVGSPGAAVCITSCTATNGAPGISHSSAGKAGVTSLLRSLGREWGPLGIRVNAVGPGTFPVEKSEAMLRHPVVREHKEETIAIGRYGALNEIVEPIVFLLSSGASYITGQTLIVDGGQTLSPWLMPRQAIEIGLNNQYID